MSRQKEYVTDELNQFPENSSGALDFVNEAAGRHIALCIEHICSEVTKDAELNSARLLLRILRNASHCAYFTSKAGAAVDKAATRLQPAPEPRFDSWLVQTAGPTSWALYGEYTTYEGAWRASRLLALTGDIRIVGIVR